MAQAREKSGASNENRCGGLAWASALAVLAVFAASCGESRPASGDGGSGASASSCVTCHGDAARLPSSTSPAPPVDTRGNTATSAAGVGAHQRHLTGGSIRQAIACSECHRVPTTADHALQPLDLTWGPLASARGASPSFDPTSLTCANYCHGSPLGGGSVTAPVWNQVDGSQAACGACHGLPPTSAHPAVAGGVTTCWRCHAGTVEADGTIDLIGGLHLNGAVDLSGTGSCTACHGDESRQPASIAAAPPTDASGNNSTSAPGVGAHQRHLVGGSMRGPIACTECHVVPSDLAHASDPLDLSWGPLARADGALPTWSGTALTCANYCHGATIAGGTLTAPVWNRVDGTQAACGTCHGLPPAAPHPAVLGSATACAACHSGTVSPDGTIIVSGGLHVNGVADVSGGASSCTGCHGDPSRPVAIAAAPPVDTSGNTATTSPGVGAHLRHLTGGAMRGPLACSDCHTVPTDLVHATEPLDLTWGELARSDGAAPSFVEASLTCANYCHGATLQGGVRTSPVWNQVDGSQAACGACHGLPPASPHPSTSGGVTNCAVCHAGTVNPDGTVKVSGGLHVNGVIDLAAGSGSSGTCTACHGDATRDGLTAVAPPFDTQGNTATSAPGVGAHLRHLEGGTVRGPIACTECHPIPTDRTHAALPTQFSWGPLARADGTSPTYDATRLTCANYCHGATLSGGAIPAPVWNEVDGTQAACGACHGLPPLAPHPAVAGLDSCADCHSGTVDATGAIVLAGGLHLNGSVELSGTAGSCTGCHGDANRSPASIAPAPPLDSRGNAATSAPGVGAHQSHLAGGATRGPIACTECHVVPTDLAHASQPLQLTWGPLARANGASPSFDPTALTCANYCHGTAATGGTVTAPVWNKVDGTQDACGACHGLPPPAPHPGVVGGVTACAGCHAGTVRGDGTIDVTAGLHVNGLVELSGTGGACTGCHGDAGRSPVAIAPAPPVDVLGNTATSAPGVGAHQRHLTGGDLSGPVACTECHAVPGDIAHASEPLQLTWGPLARTDGASPTWDGTALTCSNYCHGSTMPAGLVFAPIWNKVDGTQAACGTCHGIPPGSPHPRVGSSLSGCADCHSSTVLPDGTIDVAGRKHVNGVVEITGTGGCTGCHGDPARSPVAIAPAPPADTLGNTATTAAGVGAHQAHLAGGAVRGPIACTECHTVPGDLAHASQPLQLTWGPLAKANGTTASFDPSALTCANYCHGGTGTVPAPRWTRVDGTQAACGACHGLPPAAPHPSVAGLGSCSGCHAGTVRADGTIDLGGGLHVNGTVEISGTGGGCTGCHGDPARTPVALAPAPPLDTEGKSATTSAGVGAHQRHLTGGAVRGALACNECHAVPTDLAHATDAIRLTWGALARTGNVTPSYDATALTCANYCHGATLSAGSIPAPLWNRVDGSQAACGTCHGLPPGGGHPAVGSAPTGCATCHPDTVNPDGSIDLAGGRHVDGIVQVTGHGDYTSPAVHGPAFLDAVAVNPAATSCTGCHGIGYDGAVGVPSCNACHSAAGWATSWQSNCSFCHGSRNASAKAGYAVLEHPTWAAPPDDVAGRLGGTNSPARTGAHQAHLSGVMTGGVQIATPFACETCHALPTDLSHVDGSTARSVVSLSGAGQAGLPASLGSYDPTLGTCTTYCHGASSSGGSILAPRWSVTDGTQAACGACHGLPPVGGGHPFVASSLPGCAVCHPDTMNANGTLNVAGGRHVDGVIQASGGHGDYAAPSVHAPRFFEFASGAPGALPCTLCHGADYGTPVTAAGDSCNSCHQRAGWTGWTTNCSFCHGAATPQAKAGYAFSTQPGWAAPPDDLSGRLSGANLPARTGAHRAHLEGTTTAGVSFALPFSCATCHAVPTDLGHISGAAARAGVILSGSGQASLPSSLGTYSPDDGTCSTYCHGSIASPAWAATGVVCGSCHALPPAPSTGHPNATGLTSCSACHADTMNPDGTLDVAGGKHVNGIVNAIGHPDISLPSQHGPMFLDNLGGVPDALDCSACHGPSYDVVITSSGDSCNTCHQKAGWTGWVSNCSFCHGARNAQSKAGYSVAAFPTLAAPPDDIRGRLTGSNLAARTGAHQAHLTGTTLSGQSYAAPYACHICHAVPADLSHVGGSTSRGTVILEEGTYSPATGACSTACHGAAPSPSWSGAITQCNSCHGIAPDTGGLIYGEDAQFHSAHFFHTAYMHYACEECHAATATWVIQGSQRVDVLKPDKSAHVNRSVDVVFRYGGSWDPATGTCGADCHGGSPMPWR